MTWRPRLVATDLDGTLLGDDGTVSPRTAAAVARVEAAGVPVVIVTGRPPRWLDAIAEQLDHRGIAVCANGALIWDLHTGRSGAGGRSCNGQLPKEADASQPLGRSGAGGRDRNGQHPKEADASQPLGRSVAGRIVESDPLAPDVLRDVTSRLRAALGEASFAVEYGESFTHEAAYPVRQALANSQVRVGELADLLSQPAVKLLVRHPSYGPDEFLSKAQAILGDSVTVTHSSYDGLLEISAAGVTKATGLARVATSHGIDAEDVLVFGDMPNDLPMFAWAGRSVAVANAHPAVLDASDEITGSNTEDGVAAYLEPMFPSTRKR